MNCIRGTNKQPAGELQGDNQAPGDPRWVRTGRHIVAKRSGVEVLQNKPVQAGEEETRRLPAGGSDGSVPIRKEVGDAEGHGTSKETSYPSPTLNPAPNPMEKVATADPAAHDHMDDGGELPACVQSTVVSAASLHTQVVVDGLSPKKPVFTPTCITLIE